MFRGEIKRQSKMYGKNGGEKREGEREGYSNVVGEREGRKKREKER